MKQLLSGIVVVLSIWTNVNAQTNHYNLQQLLQQGRLETYPGNEIKKTDSTSRQSVSATGIVWLKDFQFRNGTIDIDLRGKNVFQQSFLGIAFHGKDTANYEVIYFRPFNFGSPDTIRLNHTVQYQSIPNYPWYKLRKDSPLVYESAVRPMPASTGWFHATIVVSHESITVYVNHAKEASLKVKRLGNQDNGKIGLWADGLAGDYADLSIHDEP